MEKARATASTRGRPRSSSKRLAILEAGTEVFLEAGFDGAGMDEVAVRAGVSKATVYGHFGSKEALFVAAITELTEATGVQAEQEQPLDPTNYPDQLVDLGCRQLSAVLDPRIVRLRRLVIGEHERFPELGAALFAAGPQRGIDALAGLLVDLGARGVLALDDPQAAAERLNWLMLAGPIERAMLRGERLGAAGIEAQVREAVRIFVAAYAR